jgi:hypothetical protein
MNAARERGELRAPDRDDAKDPANCELGPEEIWKEPVDSDSTCDDLCGP